MWAKREAGCNAAVPWECWNQNALQNRPQLGQKDWPSHSRINQSRHWGRGVTLAKGVPPPPLRNPRLPSQEGSGHHCLGTTTSYEDELFLWGFPAVPDPENVNIIKSLLVLLIAVPWEDREICKEGGRWLPRERELSMFSAEEQPPVLSELVRGEGQNAGRRHTILPKELSQGWSRLTGKMYKKHKL